MENQLKKYISYNLVEIRSEVDFIFDNHSKWILGDIEEDSLMDAIAHIRDINISIRQVIDEMFELMKEIRNDA